MDEFPDEQRVQETLKSNYLYLEAIREFIFDTYVETKEEWKYYGSGKDQTINGRQYF
jgi:hypothetical protein